jgi:MFS family permease
MRTLLRDRSYRSLLVGQTLSAFGDYAMFLALAVWVKVLTGSNAKAGLAILPFALPSLVGPALGVYVDRFPRRRIMIVTDLAAAVALLPLLAVHDAGDIWLIYVVSFLIGLATVVYEAARAGLLVSMLEEGDLGDANGLLQSTGQGMRLLAPLAGAALFAAFGGAAVALLDATTFVVSAMFLLAVHAPSIERGDEEHGFWVELRAGVSHIVHTADLRRLTLATAFVTLAAGVMEVAIFALIDQGLHRPPEFLGVLSTVQGVGAVIGGVVVGTTMRKIGEFSTIAWALVAIGAGVGLLAWATLPIVLVSAVAIGIAVSFYNVAFVTLIQRRTDVSMQGRVMSAVEAVFTVPYAASIVAGAILISVVSFRTIYLVQAVMFLAVAGYLTLTARDRVRRPTPSRGRRRRRARGRSSSRDGRALAAPPQRSEDRRPTP